MYAPVRKFYLLNIRRLKSYDFQVVQEADPHFLVTNLSEKKKNVIFCRGLFPRLSFSCSISALEALLKK